MPTDITAIDMMEEFSKPYAVRLLYCIVLYCIVYLLAMASIKDTNASQRDEQELSHLFIAVALPKKSFVDIFDQSSFSQYI